MKGTFKVLTSSNSDFKQGRIFWVSEITDLYTIKQSKFDRLFKLVTDKGVIFFAWDKQGIKQ